jgi:hypothetical protein
MAKDGKTATIVVDKNDWQSVLKAAHDLSDDVRKVTGVKAEVAVANSTLSTLHSTLSPLSTLLSPLSTLHSTLKSSLPTMDVVG